MRYYQERSHWQAACFLIAGMMIFNTGCSSTVAKEPSALEALLYRLGASEVEVRQETQVRLERLLTDLKGDPWKEALRRIDQVSREHPDREVRERAAGLLDPYRAGASLWEIKLRDVLPGPPELFRAAQLFPKVILVFSGDRDRRMIAYDRQTGKPLWEKTRNGLPGEVCHLQPTPEGLRLAGQKPAPPGTKRDLIWTGVYEFTTGKPVREITLNGMLLSAGSHPSIFEFEGDLMAVEEPARQGGPRPAGKVDKVLDTLLGPDLPGITLGRFDPKTGVARWIASVKVEYGVKGGTPLLLGVKPVATESKKGALLVGLDPSTGRMLWENKIPRHGVSSLIGAIPTADGLLAMVIKYGKGQMSLLSLDRLSGKVRWESDLPCGADVEGGLSAAGFLLLIRPHGEGFPQAILFDPQGKDVKWRLDPRGVCHWSRRAGELLVISEHPAGETRCTLFDLGARAPKWERRLPGAFVAGSESARQDRFQAAHREGDRIVAGEYRLENGEPVRQVTLEHLEPVLSRTATSLLFGEDVLIVTDSSTGFLGIFDAWTGRKRWEGTFKQGEFPGAVELTPEGLLMLRTNPEDSDQMFGLYRVTDAWE